MVVLARLPSSLASASASASARLLSSNVVFLRVLSIFVSLLHAVFKMFACLGLLLFDASFSALVLAMMRSNWADLEVDRHARGRGLQRDPGPRNAFPRIGVRHVPS